MSLGIDENNKSVTRLLIVLIALTTLFGCLAEEKPADLNSRGEFRAGSGEFREVDNSTISLEEDAEGVATEGGRPVTEEESTESTQVSETLLIPKINTYPNARPDRVSGIEDTIISLAAVLNNDSDSDGDSINIVRFSQGTSGVVELARPNLLRYTPNSNFNGVDQVSYTIVDTKGAESTALVTINVESVNDLPVAKSDQVIVIMDIAKEFDLLANDSGLGDGVTIELISNVSNGKLVSQSDGKFVYTPNPSFIGEDYFTYQLTDGNGDISIASVAIDVGCIETCKRFFLSWDRSVSPDVIAYRIYMGINGGAMISIADVGNVYSYEYFAKISGKYKFAISAINSNGVESDLSRPQAALF